ncbi:MAG: ACT domain-containing protein, partial [Candidatus Adiutrix sp.]|nr:ACT domain-containing protein [Candidatus Adiutrix sp.]
MSAQQLSIFLENQSGRLAEVMDVLARAEINIRALSLADTSEFGVLRLLADKPEAARAALREQGFQAQITEVAAVEVPDRPGALSRVLNAFHAAGVDVEYMYAFVGQARP